MEVLQNMRTSLMSDLLLCWLLSIATFSNAELDANSLSKRSKVTVFEGGTPDKHRGWSSRGNDNVIAKTTSRENKRGNGINWNRRKSNGQRLLLPSTRLESKLARDLKWPLVGFETSQTPGQLRAGRKKAQIKQKISIKRSRAAVTTRPRLKNRLPAWKRSHT